MDKTTTTIVDIIKIPDLLYLTPIFVFKRMIFKKDYKNIDVYVRLRHKVYHKIWTRYRRQYRHIKFDKSEIDTDYDYIENTIGLGSLMFVEVIRRIRACIIAVSSPEEIAKLPNIEVDIPILDDINRKKMKSFTNNLKLPIFNVFTNYIDFDRTLNAIKNSKVKHSAKYNDVVVKRICESLNIPISFYLKISRCFDRIPWSKEQDILSVQNYSNTVNAADDSTFTDKEQIQVQAIASDIVPVPTAAVQSATSSPELIIDEDDQISSVEQSAMDTEDFHEQVSSSQLQSSPPPLVAITGQTDDESLPPPPIPLDTVESSHHLRPIPIAPQPPLHYNPQLIPFMFDINIAQISNQQFDLYNKYMDDSIKEIQKIMYREPAKCSRICKLVIDIRKKYFGK